MGHRSNPSSLVLGLALFSMFFGSGNLIFPLLLGTTHPTAFLSAALGFILTAVLLPTLGIASMIPAQGDYYRIFDNFIPRNITKFVLLVILAFWIPFGSGPRCILLAHASIKTYVPNFMHVGWFSLLFLGLTCVCVVNKTRLIQLLGKILTPMLLLAIGFMVVSSFYTAPVPLNMDFDRPTFWHGLISGYFTQDLIAALFFSSTIVEMVKSTDKKQPVAKKLFWAGLVAVLLLTIVYSLLMAAAAVHSQSLGSFSGEKLVSNLARVSLGANFGQISAAIISLACFTTEIALVYVFASFLEREFFKGKRGFALGLTALIVWTFSLLHFDGLMKVIEPAMKVIYPLIVIVVLQYLWKTFFQDSHDKN